jgi:hypothetical protein
MNRKGNPRWRCEAYPVGAVIIKRDSRGQRFRIIKLTHHGPYHRRWRAWARWWWEKNRGPVPAGKRVAHLDGNRLNDAPENLGLLTRGELLQAIHRARPAMSARNRVKVGRAVAATNRARAELRKLRGWLVSRWYLVDPRRGVVLNRPRRMLWELCQDAGIATERRDRSAARRAIERTGLAAVSGAELAAGVFAGCRKCEVKGSGAEWTRAGPAIN